MPEYKRIVKTLCIDENAKKFMDNWDGNKNLEDREEWTSKIQILDTNYGNRILLTCEFVADTQEELYEISHDAEYLSQLFFMQHKTRCNLCYYMVHERIKPVYGNTFTDAELEVLTEKDLLYGNALNEGVPNEKVDNKRVVSVSLRMDKNEKKLIDNIVWCFIHDNKVYGRYANEDTTVSSYIRTAVREKILRDISRINEDWAYDSDIYHTDEEFIQLLLSEDYATEHAWEMPENDE
ncbi:hypothetical protein MettiDRAFT_1247 [Methanolobus tindarius DSM 2278]|uniref:Uncharacterized protein n=1 Tax=Methanolobus tindarius DSM 2278 TaxID=1090322 RepID=W9DVV6_METTI|nr:hypothetical protein [Methanolobus tindarius]ETA67812.1 hypothetical protein MettiDRAFT_1247 [Methanolobus tindarius DSM 2278]